MCTWAQTSYLGHAGPCCLAVMKHMYEISLGGEGGRLRETGKREGGEVGGGEQRRNDEGEDMHNN